MREPSAMAPTTPPTTPPAMAPTFVVCLFEFEPELEFEPDPELDEGGYVADVCSLLSVCLYAKEVVLFQVPA